MNVERIGYAAGARITGIDLHVTPDDAAMAEIRAAWLEHLVLHFPGQNLEPEELRAFGARFGTLDDNRSSPHNRHPEYPDVMVLTNKPANGKPWNGYRSGEGWHTDLSTTLHPTSATLLSCKERPRVGGDTMFANQYAAYDNLSSGMKATLGGISAIHDVTLGRGSESPEILVQARKLKPPVVQPVVRVHPETGRNALYLSHRVRRFENFSEAESASMLEFLRAHAVADEFVYRHRWTVGDVVVWDNRALLHKAPADYDLWNEGRVLFRASVLGEPSGRLFAGDTVERIEVPATV